MKINSTTTNSFKGLYIVKGNGRDIAKVISNIHKNAIPSETVKESGAKLKPLKGYTIDLLTGLYGEKQPLAQILIATENDVQLVDNYYIKLFGKSPKEDSEELDDVHLTIFQNRIDKFFKKNLENLVEYNRAQEKFIDKGDASSLSSFILKQAIQAKKKLVEILAPYSLKGEDLPTLRAENVLNAMENDSFDYVNGSVIYDEIDDRI